MTDETSQADHAGVLSAFVDFLQPVLTPYEAAVYLYLLRHSHLKTGGPQVRVGKRTIAADLGQGPRASRSNYQHISDLLRNLEIKGCVAIGATDRFGTLYAVNLPADVPAARERMLAAQEVDQPGDHYLDPLLRREIFERDRWTCQYCGDQLTEDTVTLDHYLPVSKGGGNSQENLRTSCLMCNSIKSGKSYDEAAPLLLVAVRQRRARDAQSN